MKKIFQNRFLILVTTNFFFPGTLITLYIPAIENLKELNVSSIKPDIEFASVKPQNKKYVSIASLSSKLRYFEKRTIFHLTEGVKK